MEIRKPMNSTVIHHRRLDYPAMEKKKKRKKGMYGEAHFYLARGVTFPSSFFLFFSTKERSGRGKEKRFPGSRNEGISLSLPLSIAR